MANKEVIYLEKIYAFIDECGNYGFDFSKQGVSSHFIITAIIIAEDQKEALENSVEELRKRYFQTGEMKSSQVGKDHKRRLRIIQDIKKMDFQTLILVVDKKEIFPDSGLAFKKTFYKYLNNKLHNELRISFPKLSIITDKIGRNEYMDSFRKYFEKKSGQMSIFDDESDLYFDDSISNKIIQLADFVGGSLSFSYEVNKVSEEVPNYRELLKEKICRIEIWPEYNKPYIAEKIEFKSDIDKLVFEIALRQVGLFIKKYEESIDNDECEQVVVAKYLRFKLIYDNYEGYISTKEIIDILAIGTNNRYTLQTFRQRIIAKLRDEGVIIASSSKGYKLPANAKEIYDFANHSSSIIIPMLSRIEKCRNLLKTATLGNLDILQVTEYEELKNYFDYKIKGAN